MEKQIEKLLQSQNFSKKFRIYEEPWSDIIDCVHKIQNVPLENLHIWDVDKEPVIAIFNTFQNLNLKTFAMDSCEIDPTVAMLIANFIPNLIALKLISNKMARSEFATILGAIKHSHSCSKLVLEEIIFEESERATLIDCIEGSQLTSLALTQCSFRRVETKKALATVPVSIINAIMNAPCMQTLILDYTNFDNETTAAIVCCIKNSCLIKLSLCGCTFVDNKINTIMEAIQQSSIQSLNIGCSFFDDKIEDIMGCVKNSCVTTFIFGDRVRIYDDEEMATIAASIRGDNLLHLGLNYMRISDEIFDAIKQSSIVSLDLYLNNFDGDKPALASETKMMVICDLLEQCDLKKLRTNLRIMEDAHVRTILSSIKKSELIKFRVYDIHSLSKQIKQEIKERMQKQKLRATSFNKMKSAANCDKRSEIKDNAIAQIDHFFDLPQH